MRMSDVAAVRTHATVKERPIEGVSAYLLYPPYALLTFAGWKRGQRYLFDKPRWCASCALIIGSTS